MSNFMDILFTKLIIYVTIQLELQYPPQLLRKTGEIYDRRENHYSSRNGREAGDNR